MEFFSTHRSSRSWRIATTRFLLLWFVIQSAMAVAMPVAASHECCPDNSQPTAHGHHHADISLKKRMLESIFQEGSSDSITPTIDYHYHSDCEHCLFGCQFTGPVSIALNHSFDLLKHANHQIFFLPTNPLDLPFRPPIV